MLDTKPSIKSEHDHPELPLPPSTIAHPLAAPSPDSNSNDPLSPPLAPSLTRTPSALDAKPLVSLKTESSAEDSSDESGSVASGSGSRSASASARSTPQPTATKASPRKQKVKKEEYPVQLIDHLPVAEVESSATYTELGECTYASKALGNLPYLDEDDAGRCDCGWDPDGRKEASACGEDSGCVNRLLQIECKDNCRMGMRCQNQRFQKKEYAGIEVVKTEKKGFGVRAKEDLPSDTFVYEYVGEVIGPTVFERKMKQYANDGVRHFYFMALDKDVFIDATKKGGKGRFLNHSCNPNCSVAKWTVGKKMRMGIFTKRDIGRGEELTFNYNVDRYGHVAQECYCGEPNCVGYIGGKTQTDIGGMDELYIDALGIKDEVDQLGLRGTKKKKGRKLDEDFTPTLKEITVDEVPKVSAAVRQAITTKRILSKLLSRIQMTKDAEVQAQLLRLKGFNLMNHILKEYPFDVPIITLALEILSQWPLIARNKVESSKIEEVVRRCSEMEGEEKVVSLAKKLLSNWSDLELAYRIPRAANKENGDGAAPGKRQTTDYDVEHIAKRARMSLDKDELTPFKASPRPDWVPPAPTYISTPSPRVPPTPSANGRRVGLEDLFPRFRSKPSTPGPADVSAIIERVQAEAAAKERKEAEEKRRVEEEEERRKMERSGSGSGSGSAKEKKVMSLFSSVVVQQMSKYKAHLEADQFKKRAKELTQILCDKEKKHPLYNTEPYDHLTPEKTSKIKQFTKEWTRKLIDRTRAASNSTSTSASASTSRSQLGFGTPTSATSATASPSSIADRIIGVPSASASRKASVEVSPATPSAGSGGGGLSASEGTPMELDAGDGGETPPGTPPSKRKGFVNLE